MIGLGYSRVKSFDPSSSTGETVVSGRASLTSLVVHTNGITTDFVIQPLVFMDGDGGDIRYKFKPWCIPDALTKINHLTYQVNMGSAGILFKNEIWFQWEADGSSSEGVDNVVLFFI